MNIYSVAGLFGITALALITFMFEAEPPNSLKGLQEAANYNRSHLANVRSYIAQTNSSSRRTDSVAIRFYDGSYCLAFRSTYNSSNFHVRYERPFGGIAVVRAYSMQRRPIKLTYRFYPRSACNNDKHAYGFIRETSGQSSGTAASHSSSATAAQAAEAKRNRDMTKIYTALSKTGRVLKIQYHLKRQGFDPGRIDGIQGAKTRSAIRKWQIRHNYAATGAITIQQFFELTK